MSVGGAGVGAPAASTLPVLHTRVRRLLRRRGRGAWIAVRRAVAGGEDGHVVAFGLLGRLSEERRKNHGGEQIKAGRVAAGRV